MRSSIEPATQQLLWLQMLLWKHLIKHILVTYQSQLNIVKSIWCWLSIRGNNKGGCVSLQGRITHNTGQHSPFSISVLLLRTCHRTSTFWRSNAAICMEVTYQAYFLTYRQWAYLYLKEVSNHEWCARFQLLLLLLRCLLWFDPSVTTRLWATAPPNVLIFNSSDRVRSCGMFDMKMFNYSMQNHNTLVTESSQSSLA